MLEDTVSTAHCVLQQDAHTFLPDSVGVTHTHTCAHTHTHTHTHIHTHTVHRMCYRPTSSGGSGLANCGGDEEIQ